MALLTTVASISSAQLKTIHSSPTEIIAAPGANKMILLLGAAAYFIYGTVPYSGVSGPSLFYGGLTPTLALSDYFFGFGGSISQIQTTRGLDDHEPPTLFLDQAIIFYDPVSPDYTLGDGTAKIFVPYVIADFS